MSKKHETKSQVFDTMQQASAALKIPMRELKRAKAGGCPAFRGARVHEAELVEWLAANPAPDSGGDPREEKIREEIRKLRIRNERDEGALIPRAWVAERIQRAAGEWAALRLKWEAEAPVEMSAAHGDVASQRIAARKLTDGIASILQSLSASFAP